MGAYPASLNGTGPFIVGLFYSPVVVTMAPTAAEDITTDVFENERNSSTSTKTLYYIVGGSVGLFLMLVILSVMALVTVSTVVLMSKKKSAEILGQY